MSKAETIRVVVADDHALVREAIKAVIGAMDAVEVVAEARDGRELLKVLETILPDVVITDLDMPNMDGVDAMTEIRRTHPDLPVLALTMNDDVQLVKRTVALGASGYVMKNCQPQELEQAIRACSRCGSYFSSQVAQALLRPEPVADDELTDRQREILALVAKGYASKEIGFQLGLSSKTVDAHRLRIMGRLQIYDVAGLTRYALRKQLISA